MTRPTTSPGFLRRCCLSAVALALAAFASGCVTVYQPLTSLQQPVVVDPGLPNFEGMRLLVRCLPNEYLGASDSQRLCRRVGQLFRNQGAEVDIEVPRNGRSTRDEEVSMTPDLIVDLKSRQLHQQDSTLMAILSGLTFTLVPTWSEYTFAQDITVRDTTGFLLAQDSVQARFIEYYGVGIWGVNWVLDLLVRPDEDELAGDNAKKDFSRDYYGHLSQLVYNARVRSVVLKGFEN